MKGRKGEYNDRVGSYGGMIKENTSAPANLPQEVVHKQYASNLEDPNYKYEDSIVGVDAKARENNRLLRDQMSKGMRG